MGNPLLTSRIFCGGEIYFFSPLAAEFRFGKIFSRKVGTVPAEKPLLTD
jgi:hypothetical protein